mmetsp:Transcript_9925/g.24161  ORF Transcript_9925/g.24161 Transcript_9925/m.24161 type:complete len:183 (-) Transcript_9925:96-644(-)
MVGTREVGTRDGRAAEARLDGLCVDDELMMGGSRGGAVALREVRFRRFRDRRPAELPRALPRRPTDRMPTAPPLAQPPPPTAPLGGVGIAEGPMPSTAAEWQERFDGLDVDDAPMVGSSGGRVAATGEAYRTCPHRSLAGGWVDGRGAVKRVAAGVNVVGGTCYPPRVWACARVPAALRIEF